MLSGTFLYGTKPCKMLILLPRMIQYIFRLYMLKKFTEAVETIKQNYNKNMPRYCYIFVGGIERAKKLSPNAISLENGDFLDIKYESREYDCILLFTVLSSILNEKFRQKNVKKSYKLLKPGGIAIKIYDFTYNNPWNKSVQAVNLRKIKVWFYKEKPTTCKFSRITLCPPLARQLENFPLIQTDLSNLKLFNTHIIGFLKK